MSQLPSMQPLSPLAADRSLTLLLNIIQEISVVRDPDELAPLVAQRLAHDLGYALTSFYVLDEDSQLLQPLGATGDERSVMLELPLHGPGVIARAARTAEPVMVRDVHTEQDYIALLPGMRSELAVPMVLYGRTLGVLNLESDQPDAFDAEAVSMLVALAGQMAVALDNARLYRRLNTQRDALAHETRRLQAISRIATLGRQDSDSTTVLEASVIELAKLLDVDQCALMLFDFEHNYGYVVAEYVPTPQIEQLRVPLHGNDSVDWLIQQRSSLVIEDVANDERIALSRGALLSLGISSILIVPLIIKGEVVGSFGLSTIGRERSFSSADIDACQTISQQAAGVIQTTRLHEETLLRLREQATIARVSAAVLSSLDLPEVLEAIAEGIAEALDVAACIISHWHAGNNTVQALTAYARRGAIAVAIGTAHTLNAYPATAQVLHNAQPLVVYVDDPAADSAEVDFLHFCGQHTLLMLPLTGRNGVIGLVELLDGRMRRFTSDELQLAQTLLAQAAVAIEHAWLYEREQRHAEQMALINELGRHLTLLLEPGPLLREAAQLVRDGFDFVQVDIAVLGHNRLIGYGAAGQRTQPLSVDEFQQGLAGQAAREARLVRRVASGEHTMQLDNLYTIRDELALPLEVGRGVIGVLSMQSAKPNVFDSNDTALYSTLADQIAVALSNALLYEQSVARIAHELQIAQAIQQSLLPQQPPTIPGIEIAWRYQPTHEVSGDFYDAMLLDQHTGSNKLCLMVADVTGKGVPASMVAIAARNTLRSEIRHAPFPGPLLTLLNRLFAQDQQRHLVGLNYLLLDLQTHRLTYATAGQLAPALLRDGELRYLQPPGPTLPLGAMTGISYQTGTIRLNRGDSVVCYTDGIVEATNSARELFGFERFAEVLQAHAHASAADMVDAVWQALNTFVGSAEQHDDITLLVAKMSDE